MFNRPPETNRRYRGRTTHSFLMIASLWAVAPGAALAAPGIEILLRGATLREEDRDIVVELRLLNPGEVEGSIALPDRIEARIESRDGDKSVILTRTADTSEKLSVAAHGFAVAGYRLPADQAQEATLLSIPAWSTQAIRLTRTDPAQIAEQDETGTAPAESLAVTPPSEKAMGNDFLDNLAAYEPIYAAYGPGTNSDARIQISFKYKLFGSHNASSGTQGLHFAYLARRNTRR